MAAPLSCDLAALHAADAAAVLRAGRGGDWPATSDVATLGHAGGAGADRHQLGTVDASSGRRPTAGSCRASPGHGSVALDEASPDPDAARTVVAETKGHYIEGVAYFNQTVGDRILFAVDQSTLSPEARTILAASSMFSARSSE